MTTAKAVHVRGVVQGVGFRPFIFRLARAHALAGWVTNQENGVTIHLEGAEEELNGFIRDLEQNPPPAARIASIDVAPSEIADLTGFAIHDSHRDGRPTVPISPDLPVCEQCLAEMRDPVNPRHGYEYINCTNCGPRYTVVERLPYDRPNTTMRHWSMDALCNSEYHDPSDRRFHAQPIACPNCGPRYSHTAREIAQMLCAGSIVAIKGVGGYHLACDARNAATVAALRERKFRKEKPFAAMARDLAVAHTLVRLSAAGEKLLLSNARPIVVAPKHVDLPGVAPGNHDLGVLLPYAPVHYLLFDAGGPDVLVMTSANRSNEPIAFEDDDAGERLTGIADVFFTGERPIARRVDDSVAMDGPLGPMLVRRSRGYAPGAVCTVPSARPILALGADLKNTITLVAGRQAFVSQHIGDLDDYGAQKAFRETIADLTSMYEISWDDLLVVHDAHPEYVSSQYADSLPAPRKFAAQHHRAHIASVLAERQAWSLPVIGVGLDGTGYGDDGGIWGGEFFHGSIADGFERVCHLRPASLPGGDAAARCPAQCAAGFLAQMDTGALDMPERFHRALALVRSGVRTFRTTSVGRLFDTAAALLGFTREITFEGQAAIWLEFLAQQTPSGAAYPFPFSGSELDFRPLLEAVIEERRRGRPHEEIARSFHLGVAQGIAKAAAALCETFGVDTVVLSGGVFQNRLLLAELKGTSLKIWTNQYVPPNDGGISLGQAALGCYHA